MNIFESIPVIGFLPIVFAIFVSGIGGSLGVEMAADFLVFDAIVWNIWIGIYQAFKTVPEHVIEVSENYNFGFWSKLRHLYVPFSFPCISSDIFPSFADTLFYIMVSEVFAIGITTYKVFGVGALIVNFTSNGDLDSVIVCLGILGVGVSAVTLWFNKLSRHAVAKYGLNTPPEIKRRIVYNKPHTRMWYLSRSPTFDLSLRTARFKKPGEYIQQLVVARARRGRSTDDAKMEKWVKYIGLSIVGIFLAYIAYSSIQLILSVPNEQWNSYLAQTPTLLYAMGIDYLRVLVITAISFVLAMTLGYYLAVHSKISIVSLPVIQTLSAFPAPAYFPLLFVAIAPFLMHAIPFAATEIIILTLAFLAVGCKN